MDRLQITTLAGQDISAPLLVATYTADADRELLIQVYLSDLTGDGIYRACATKQLAGIGAIYQSPTTAAAVGATVTTVYLPGVPLPIQDTDVVNIYVQGLAGDVAVAVQVEVFDTQEGLAMEGADADTLETLSDQIDGVCTLGAGAFTWTYTLTSAVPPFGPIPDADIWVSTDIGGLFVIASGRTDAFGVVTFYLDAGPIFVWRQKSGWNFINPDPEIVP